MRHKAYVPGVALLAALAVGCSAGGDGDASGGDSKPGGPTVSPAPPGKYLTLPAPCRAVPRTTLGDLLPGAAELPDAQRDKVFRGVPAVTHDTDRKVGCGWKSDAPDATRSLSVDLERVVSYDPAVSDDDRADTVYGKKERAADLSAATPGPDAEKSAGKSGEPDPEKAKPTSSDGASASPSPSGSSPSASSSASPGVDGGGDGGSPADDLRPRVLDDLGDAAFLDDLLTRAGSTAQHRTVSVVFRTSNVIVTVRYAEQPVLVTKVPDSRELQEKAQALARKLAETLSE
ncbi:DUF3558 domain-containing protein [Streptomyces sp. NPDC049916]|uniref:DUF3558 domain-containing protein n=1 Tax=Streptomyces sp. NPDC049916 TaxID=3155156 RepID=UPI00343070AE